MQICSRSLKLKKPETATFFIMHTYTHTRTHTQIPTQTPNKAPAFPSFILHLACRVVLFLAQAGRCVSRGRVWFLLHWSDLKDGVKTSAIFIRHHFNSLSWVRVSGGTQRLNVLVPLLLQASLTPPVSLLHFASALTKEASRRSYLS